jgi:hypothetical protein
MVKFGVSCNKVKCFCLSETASLIQITTNQVLKVCLHYGKILSKLPGCIKQNVFFFLKPLDYNKLLQNTCLRFVYTTVKFRANWPVV